ncbi:MAG TPA: DUF6090 family protein [Rhodanobacteraceae bacterium]|nr:DUF6090 family protein [Rhodanobacteraceae bacterium]
MLRHAIVHLRRQDWTAVFIELVVVVVGVFIGVQASNWNEQRETDQKAAVFTQRLKSDLREEAWGYELEVGYWSQVLANAKRAADALDGKAPLSDQALLISAYRATQFNAYTRRRATYDELTATGEIGLIRDSALRDLATRLYTDPLFNGIAQAGQQAEYRKAFRRALPYQVQQALADRCGDHIVPVGNYRAIAHVLDYPCSTGLPPDVIAASDDALRKDPRVLASLQLRIADLESDLGNMTVYYAHDFREPLRRLAKEKP